MSEQFRKKPVVIDAVQWFKNGDHPDDGRETFPERNTPGMPSTFSPLYTGEYAGQLLEGKVVRYFRRPDVGGEAPCRHCGVRMHEHGWIDTLEGGHIVCPGDWVIRGVKGEFYPCKPDVFAATYEPVAPPLTAGPVAPPPELLPYERISSERLSAAIRLMPGEQLLVLQPFGWHIDGHHIPNAAEQFSREGVCEEHGWQVVCEFGPYVAVVRAKQIEKEFGEAPRGAARPPQPQFGGFLCADCKAPINAGEAKCFNVCDACWQKTYPTADRVTAGPPASPPALEAWQEVLQQLAEAITGQSPDEAKTWTPQSLCALARAHRSDSEDRDEMEARLEAALAVPPEAPPP